MTPVDRTLARYAEEWLFLTRARHLVPDGSSVTVRAAEFHRELSLFMLSVGLYPDARPLPGRYWEQPDQHRSRRTEFLLSFRCVPPEDQGLRQIATFDDGCVFRRVPAR